MKRIHIVAAALLMASSAYAADINDYLPKTLPQSTPLPTDAGPLQYYPSTAPTPAPQPESYGPTHVYGGQTCSNGSCNGWDSTGGHWMTTESSGTTTGFYNRY